MSECKHCDALRHALLRLRRENAGVKSAYVKLRAECALLKETVSLDLVRHNVGPSVKAERIALIKRLRQNYSTAEIAVLIGYSRQRVHQLLKEDDYINKQRASRIYADRRKMSENLTLEASQNLKSLNP